MVCKIMWAEGVALRGAEAATGYKVLAKATTEKTYKKKHKEKKTKKS